MSAHTSLASAAAAAVLLWPLSGWGQTNFVRIKSFGDANQSGSNPEAGVIEGSDGKLYGTAIYGGCGFGVVFQLRKDGTGYRVLQLFREDLYPTAPLIEASDGALYGISVRSDVGAVFKLNKDGSDFQVLRRYRVHDYWGERQGALLEGSDGTLYGTQRASFESGAGNVFKINKDGSGYLALYVFQFPVDMVPVGGLVMGSDGALYGATEGSGTPNVSGVVFKLNQDGSGYATLHRFTGSPADGIAPVGALVRGSDGAFYGTTKFGGAADAGTVFKLNSDGSNYVVLHSFTNAPGDGANPLAALIEGSSGALYGTTSTGGIAHVGTVFKLNKDGSGFAVLHSFTNSPGDGASPQGALVKGKDGILYGTTYAGGSDNLGTVFKLNEDGSGYAKLFSFIKPRNSINLQGPLIEGSDDTLYGVSYSGGAAGWGTAFGLSSNGANYRILHNFTNVPGDGANPQAVPIEGSDGTLYGTTVSGGNATYGDGVVFKVGKDGSAYSILHYFTNAPGDGAGPSAPLLEGSDGALYGVTERGGSGAGHFGTIFKLGKDGNGYSVLHNFTTNAPDGIVPFNPLMEGSDGVLYGTCYQGGSHDNGIVFKLRKDGTGYVILRHFDAVPDGAYPESGLVEGSDGGLYGAAAYGGSDYGGTVFKLNKDGGGYLLLHSFDSITGHARGLLKGRDGALYGTSYGGVFKLNQDGSGFTILSRSVGPFSPLMQTRNGDLYGVTRDDGLTCQGTIFALFLEPRSWFTGWDIGSGTFASASALGAAGVSFRLQCSTDLANPLWSDVSTNIASEIGELDFTNFPVTGPRSFYRLVGR